MVKPAMASGKGVSTSPRAGVAASPAEPYQAVADTLLRSAGVASGDHRLLQHNVTHYVAQFMSQRQAEHLRGATADTVLAALKDSRWPGARRWYGKIERDLQTPYTDEQVLDHLRKLDQDLREYVASSPCPLQVYVGGSLVKGRFSAHSDVDGLVQVEPPAGRAYTRERFLAAPEEGLILLPLERDSEARRQTIQLITGAETKLNLDDPHALENLYRAVLDQKGVSLDNVAAIAAQPPTREAPRLDVMAMLLKEETTRAEKLEKATRPARLALAETALGLAASHALGGPLKFCLHQLLGNPDTSWLARKQAG